MPVVPRQVIQRPQKQGNNVLQQILQTLSVGTNIWSTVTDIRSLGERLGLERERVDLSKRDVELREQNQQKAEDALTVSTMTGLLASMRSPLATAEMSPEDRMRVMLSPYRISDLPTPEMRERMTDVVARQLQMTPEEVPADFMVGQATMGDLLDSEITNLTLQKLMNLQVSDDPADASLMDSIVMGALGAQMGLPPGETPRGYQIESLFSDYLFREFFRVEEGPDGRPMIQGSIPNNPGAAARTAADALGIRLFMEQPVRMGDGNIRNVVVPQTVLDDVARYAMEEPFRATADVRQSRLSLINRMSGDMNMPTSVATAIIDGNMEAIPEEWSTLSETLLAHRWLADVNLLALQPWYKAVEAAAGLGREAGMEGRALQEFVVNTVNEEAATNPAIDPIERTGWINSYLQLQEKTGNPNILETVRTGILGQALGPGAANPFNPAAPISFGGYNFRYNGGVLSPEDPSLTFDQLSNSFLTNVGQIAGYLATLEPEQADAELANIGSLLFQFGTGTPQSILTPAQVELLREQANAMRAQQDAIPLERILGTNP